MTRPFALDGAGLPEVIVAVNEGEVAHWLSWLPPATVMVVPAAGTRAFPRLAKTTLKTTGESA